MPLRTINYESASKSLKLSKDTSDTADTPVIATDLGNALLEIQGELILPKEKPTDLTPEEEEKFSQLQGAEWAVRFGKLEIEGKKATLFIGTTQRLLGDLKKLDPPLALMKIPDEDSGKQIEIVDVIKYRLVFTGRPLPIM